MYLFVYFHLVIDFLYVFDIFHLICLFYAHVI